MLLNSGGWLGGNSGGGEGGTIIVQGSQNYSVTTIAQMNAIPSPKNGDLCFVSDNNEMYMYTNSKWNKLPVGQVDLTNDPTSTSEKQAVSAKALSTAIDDLKLYTDNKVDDIKTWENFEL